MTTRRGFIGHLVGGAAAAPLAANGALAATRVVAGDAAAAAGRLALASGIPVLDVVRRIVEPYSFPGKKARIDMVGEKVARIVKSRPAFDHDSNQCVFVDKVTHVHVDSLLYGEPHGEAMAADPVGLPIFLDELASRELGPNSTGLCHDSLFGKKTWKEELARSAELLEKNGRLGDARNVGQAARCLAIHRSLVEQTPNFDLVPRRIQELVKEANAAASFREVPGPAFRKRMLAAARAQRRLRDALVAYGSRAKPEKSLAKRILRRYREARSEIISREKWGEFRWLDGVLRERRRVSRWGPAYRAKRRAHFERELEIRGRFRGAVLSALEEHLREGRGREADVCLRVVGRLDVLASVAREVLEEPFDPAPEDVAKEAFQDWWSGQVEDMWRAWRRED